jgi:pimeloyl-ACP methyl ester carboxylesterase
MCVHSPTSDSGPRLSIVFASQPQTNARLADVGHWPPLDAPEVVAEAIVEAAS